MTLPKFQEPDWSQLPPEAVAWAVDYNGDAFIYSKTPSLRDHRWDSGGHVIRFTSHVNLTDIDWRTTLRLRPVEPAMVDHRPEIQALTESVEGLTSEQRNYELERLAEEAWKALLFMDVSNDRIAREAFSAAEAFIAEREKRRNK